MFQHTTVNRQADNKTGNNRRLSLTMGNVIYVDWITGGKVWGLYGENVRGIVNKVNRGIGYSDES